MFGQVYSARQSQATNKSTATISIMYASGEQLAQTRPNPTTAQSAFTASLHTEITLIVVCNTTASAADFSIYHDDDGSTFTQVTALHYAQSIPANSTVYLGTEAPGGFIVMSPDGQLGVQTDTADALTFTIYGVTEAIAA